MPVGTIFYTPGIEPTLSGTRPPCTSIILCSRCFLLTPPPCISYANVHNYYGPYTYCSLAINSGMFSDRSPPTDLCPLIQCIHRHGGEAAVAVHPPIRRQRRRHGSSG